MSMSSMLTEPASERSRSVANKHQDKVDPTRVLSTLEEHIILDGFRIVIDLEKSRGSYLYDAAHDHRLIDLYGFFGSMPIGFNHPYLHQPEVERDLLEAARTKVANSDIYSQVLAEFVETFT